MTHIDKHFLFNPVVIPVATGLKKGKKLPGKRVLCLIQSYLMAESLEQSVSIRQYEKL
jgi:hypothetical protein